MEANGRHLSADQTWEQRKADRLLRRLDLHESLAALTEAANSNLRGAFAREYRALIGVDVEQRETLRTCLHRLDGATVADVIDRVNDI